MGNFAEISDGALAQAAAAGDLAAFEVLVGRYQRLLYRDALGYLGSHDDALDAVQEALVGALRRFHQLREPVKVGPWLRAAVRHRSLNMLRSQRRRMEAHAGYGQRAVVEAPLEGGISDPAARLLGLLPKSSATAFLLHYVDGLPLAEVAKQLDTNTSSVKQRLYRARRHLQTEALVMAKEQGDALSEDFNARVVAHLLKSGEDDRMHMRYEAAKAHFNEVLAIEPGHPVALLEWGRTYNPFGWPDADQVGALERAAKAAPDSIEVLAELELAYRQPGFEGQHKALSEKLLERLARLLAKDGADVDALRCKARYLMGRQAFESALDLLSIALKEAPQNQAIEYQYGLCLSRLGRRDEAVPVYRAVIEKGESSFWGFSAHRQLATHLAYRADDIEGALAHMEAGWRLSGWVNERGNLIYFCSGANRLDRALALFEEAPDEPYHPRVYATVGMAYLQTNRLGEAAKLLGLAVEKATDANFIAELDLHLARIAAQSGQAELANRHLGAGLVLDLNKRSALAASKPNSFWRRWTHWLEETLGTLGEEWAEVEDLLVAVRRDLAAY